MEQLALGPHDKVRLAERLQALAALGAEQPARGADSKRMMMVTVVTKVTEVFMDV